MKVNIEKHHLGGVPPRLFITMGSLFLVVVIFAFALISFGPPITILGSVGGLPIHPLVVHATVVSVVAAAIGTIALAVRPEWRHKYGYLLIWILVIMVVSTWIAVESGNILTALPGLGSSAHADGGRLLMAMVIPFSMLSSAMVIIDRFVMVKTNQFGDLYRRRIKRNGKPRVYHHYILKAVIVLAVIAAVLVLGQVFIVGHSGAAASWGGLF